ncbi:serine/threonine-protein kinase GL21140 [Diorhabda sublineata]|uniref:serine/threonine-protein kinase GL21140 n=1 Tax=Diorhabda sublineata TaxID=1163346 RepID=UPI0024E0A006|nr:serine/threonine-protein kinase GL21140 [Diorhabda sublineata]
MTNRRCSYVKFPEKNTVNYMVESYNKNFCNKNSELKCYCENIIEYKNTTNMSKNNLTDNGSRSVSSNSFNSFLSDGDIIESGLEDVSITNKHNRPSSTSKSMKAKRIRFYHNGNKFFSGVVIPVAPERYRSFDSLTNELTNILTKSVTLPNGVRNIYAMDGKKISNIDDLEDGKEYVVCGKGELFKKIDYTKTDILKPKRLSNTKFTLNNMSSVPRIVVPDCVRPKIVTIIRNGIKPRKIYRLLLNKRNSPSLEQVLSAFSEIAQFAVRKVFSISGQSINDLSQFFENDDVFFIYGNEKYQSSDFELEFEESKAIQSYKKTTIHRNGGGPKPKMPKKELNRTYESEESLLKKLSEESNLILPPPLKSKYVVGRKVIGDGNFAVVRLCRDITTNKEYALKIIDKSKCKGKEDMIENEVKILRKVDHPNIMSLITDADTKNILYLVCEYVTGGDLFDQITIAQKYSEEQAALMINNLVSALAYLHSINIVHRDVKPENLLVELDDNYRVKLLKLGDFGLACEVTRPLYTVCGTPTYVAPEILTESGYGLKIDVWAAGVILYILLCGYPPFVSQDNDQEKLFDCILSGQYEFPEEYWQDVSSSAKELIQNMLQLDPELRFSAEDVLDHPWLQTISA